MIKEKNYHLSPALDSVKTCLEIDRRVRDKLRLTYAEDGRRKADNTFCVYVNDTEHCTYDSLDEFLAHAPSLSSVTHFDFRPAYKPRSLFPGRDTISVWLVGWLRVDLSDPERKKRWEVGVNVGTTGDVSIIDRIFPMVEQCLAPNLCPRETA